MMENLTKREFKILLSKAKLNQKGFANMVGITQQAVNNWGCSKEFPYWVKSYLENYVELLEYRELNQRMMNLASKNM